MTSPAPEQPTYTLDEAHRILRHQLCLDAGGHDLEQIVVATMSGKATVLVIRCERCRTEFVERPPLPQCDGSCGDPDPHGLHTEPNP